MFLCCLSVNWKGNGTVLTQATQLGRKPQSCERFRGRRAQAFPGTDMSATALLPSGCPGSLWVPQRFHTTDTRAWLLVSCILVSTSPFCVPGIVLLCLQVKRLNHSPLVKKKAGSERS